MTETALTYAGCPDLPYATERELAVMQLLADPLTSRMGPAELPELVTCADAALALGRAEAERLDVRDPEELLRERRVALHRIPGEGPGARAGYHLAALTTCDLNHPEKSHVDLYVDVIARKREGLLAAGVRVGQEALERLHLAHECFHVIDFLEHRRSADKVGTVNVRGAFFRSRRRALGRASEVAAHAFARAWMGAVLVPSPALADELALLGMGESSREGFARRLERARGLIGADESGLPAL